MTVSHVSAYQISNGKKLWQHDVLNASPQENTNYVSKAAPTPAADEAGLIGFFEGGNLVALTHKGEVRWKRNLVEEYGPIDARHGLGASVEQTPRVAFLWVERQTDPYLLAVDKKTGETLWKVPGLGVTSWASPRLIPVKGGEHLVLSGIGKLVGFDPQTGQRLWTLSDISGNSTPTPVPLGNGRFVMGATEGRGESDSGHSAQSNGVIAIQPTDGGGWKASYLWRAKRATSSFGSPIGHSGNVYFVNRTGVLYCLDAENGQEHYAQRIIAGSIWATPIAGEDRIWLFGKDGVVQSLQTGNSFRSLKEIDLFSPTNSESDSKEPSPSADSTLYAGIAVGDILLLRSSDRLYCLRR